MILLASILAAISIALTDCGQNFNSNSGDHAGGGISCPNDANLCIAYDVITNNHCFDCHQWSSYTTDADWIGAGLINPGNPTKSLIISNLKNSGGAMPQNFGALSNSDFNALVTWIQNL